MFLCSYIQSKGNIEMCSRNIINTKTTKKKINS